MLPLAVERTSRDGVEVLFVEGEIDAATAPRLIAALNDAVAGAVSLAVIMWVAYLSEVVSLGSDSLETILNVTYPSADILLVTALMVLAMRRSAPTAPWVDSSSCVTCA